MSEYQTEINQLANEIAQSKFWDKPRSREFVLRLADQITIPLAGWMMVRSCGVFEHCSPSSYGGPDDSFGIDTYPGGRSLWSALRALDASCKREAKRIQSEMISEGVDDGWDSAYPQYPNNEDYMKAYVSAQTAAENKKKRWAAALKIAKVLTDEDIVIGAEYQLRDGGEDVHIWSRNSNPRKKAWSCRYSIKNNRFISCNADELLDPDDMRRCLKSVRI